MNRRTLVLLVALPAGTVLLTLGAVLYDMRGATPGRRVIPLTRAVEIEVPIFVVATFVYRWLQMQRPSGVAGPRPGSAAERRALGLRVGPIDVAAALVFLTCLGLTASALWRDHVRLAEQRERIADAVVQQVEYSAAVNAAGVYTAAHPHANLAQLQEMTRLNAETLRLGQRQSTLVGRMVAAGPSRSPTHDLPLWGLIVLPSIWAAWQGWTRKRRLARRENGLCVHCGYDLRATTGRCPECGAVPADVQPSAALQSE